MMYMDIMVRLQGKHPVQSQKKTINSKEQLQECVPKQLCHMCLQEDEPR